MESKKNKTEKAKANLKELFSPVIEESVAEELPPLQAPLQAPKKEKKNKETKAKGTKRKTFNIPNDMDEQLEILIYMNRDIDDYTDLVLKVLKKYLNTKENKELIEEYYRIKGV